jgi:ribonuclease R
MSKKKKKSKAKGIKKLTDQVLDFMEKNPTKAFNYKQIARQLNIKNKQKKKLIIDILERLAGEELLHEVKKGKYQAVVKSSQITGRVEMTANGTGYLISDEIQEDIFISNRNLRHSLPGDKVQVKLYAHRKNKQLEGEVIKILERAKTQFVGKVSISKNFAFLVTASKNVPYDIFIPLKKLKNAQEGQKAIARITDWPPEVNNPFGEIVEVLGDSGENEAEMHAILAEFDLPYEFPEAVEKCSIRTSGKNN